MKAHIPASLGLLVSLAAIGAGSTSAQTAADRGNATAGREFAVGVCAGCHVVAADQPFAPLISGVPSFKEIANRPNVSAASLRRTISMLPQVPSHGRMANPLINEHELADVVAYVMTLREHGENR
jgi:mono/diheme cytochrome c family protein